MEQEKKKEEKKVVKAPRVKSKAPVRFNPLLKINLFHNSYILDYGSRASSWDSEGENWCFFIANCLTLIEGRKLKTKTRLY